MRLPTAVMGAGCSFCLWATAAPEPATPPPAAAKPVESLIESLSDDRFRVREDASLELWKLGDKVLPALQEAAANKDPERAYRARELIRKIELYITPDTDPAVILLVERYTKAPLPEKRELFDKLREKRAWRQILKLYAAETHPELQTEFQPLANAVAVTAARECLKKGESDGAREFLEMAPADSAGLLALADFHRSHGTLNSELQRALTLRGPKAAAWQLALQRISGNLEAARQTATTAGEPVVSAAMSTLLGDPLPWLGMAPPRNGDLRPYKPYTDIAIKRWKGAPVTEADWAALERSANSRSETERGRGISALFLLGETRRGEAALLKESPREAFVYFDSMEMIPQALSALGLDKDSPDFAGWVAERVRLIASESAKDPSEPAGDSEELLLLANFMERRGLRQECEKAFIAPLLSLAQDHHETFLDILGKLFEASKAQGGAPELAMTLATAWVGNDGERWEDVIGLAFSEMDDPVSIWNWLEDLDRKAGPEARLEALLVLSGRIHDPRHLREKWLALGWALVDKTPEERRAAIYEKLRLFGQLVPDLASDRKLWKLPDDEGDRSLAARLPEFPAAGLWNEAAEFFLARIDRNDGPATGNVVVFHAYAAASLRRAGRNEEAARQDEWVEKLALGNDAFEIAKAYQYGLDYPRALAWFDRAARQENPSDTTYLTILATYNEALMEARSWKIVGAINEVVAQRMSCQDAVAGNPAEKVVYRMQADLGRALTQLPKDRSGAIATLAAAHAMCPTSGSLADHFLPGVREAGLVREHDEWFQRSWNSLAEVVRRYPESENTRNTAGWLASRARRNLPQAEEFLKKALALNPTESSYLDTMAEIQFAMGKRDKALEWSARAVNFGPSSTVLHRQYQHFLNDPLPK